MAQETHSSRATVTLATIEELWEAVFTVGSMQRLYVENRNQESQLRRGWLAVE
jgi:hypothetical protein